MPRKKGERMTKQIRAYEETVDFIAAMLVNSPAGTTMADVLEKAVRKAYPDAYDRVVKAKRQADQILNEALGEVQDDS